MKLYNTRARNLVEVSVLLIRSLPDNQQMEEMQEQDEDIEMAYCSRKMQGEN